MTDINGRTAFITGAANGIGLGIARSLARGGARLALIDLDAEALADAERELSATTDVFTAVLDVRDRGAFARTADAAEDRLGAVTLLVNNAGVFSGAPVDRLSYDLWDWGLEINLGGVINGIQTFLPRMLERGDTGHIVNTASGQGLVARPGSVIYCTSKFAVVGMSEVLALDLAGRGIGVSVLCPGPVATDIIDRTQALRTASGAAPASPHEERGLEQGKRHIAAGLSPDLVGDMVCDAIAKDQLHIHTHSEIRPLIEQRCAALLDALAPLRRG